MIVAVFAKIGAAQRHLPESPYETDRGQSAEQNCRVRCEDARPRRRHALISVQNIIEHTLRLRIGRGRGERERQPQGGQMQAS